MDKAPDAFRTISEVAEETDVPQHVLRFWESRFSQIKPLKRGGGRRYYRPDDVDLLRGIRHLLYGEGYTIRGVQRLLREEGLAFVQSVWRTDAAGLPAEKPALHLAESGDEPVIGRHADVGPTVQRPVPLAGPAAPVTRREPVLPMPLAAEVKGAASTAAKSAIKDVATETTHQFDHERHRTLQEALDELIACRRIIELALAVAIAGDAPAADGGSSVASRT